MKKCSKENLGPQKDGGSAKRESMERQSDVRAKGRKESGNAEMASEATRPAKRRVGRPSRYRPEYCEAILAHFHVELERSVEVTRLGDDGTPVTVTETVANPFPTFARFASEVGVTRETLRNWCAAHDDFAFAHERARDLQTDLLIKGGLHRVYPANFAILALKNLAGWRDRPEPPATATVTPVTVAELDKLYRDGMANVAAGRNAVEIRRQARQQSESRHE
jgi:hypothetical protein